MTGGDGSIQFPGGATGRIRTVALLGSFGPPGLTAARSYHAQGIEVVYLEISPGAASARSSAISRVLRIDPAAIGQPSGLSAIARAIEQTGAQALLPLWDTQMHWLAAHRSSLPPGCKLLASSIASLERTQTKRNQVHVARSSGFPVLPTWELLAPSQIGDIDASAYPICLRPSVPEQVQPTFKVKWLASPAEAAEFLLQHTWGPEPLLAQPFKALPNLVLHGVRSESGQLLALQSFLAPMKFLGVALELRPWHLDEQLAQCCARFLAELDITGPFHFDLLYSAEEKLAYYLEINTRLGGTTDKVVRLGFDEPLLTLEAYGFTIPRREYRRPGGRVVVDRRYLLKQMVFAMRGRISPLDYPEMSLARRFVRSLFDVAWAKDSIASVRDLRGTWAYYNPLPRLHLPGRLFGTRFRTGS